MNNLGRLVAAGLVVAGGLCAHAEVTLYNLHLRWTINDDGTTAELVIKSSGENIADDGARPFAMLHDARGWHAARSVEADGEQWTVTFAGVDQPVKLNACAETDHLWIGPVGKMPPGTDQLVFAQVCLKVPRQSVGHYWPMGRVGDTYVLLAPLTPQTRTSYSYGRDGALFRAEALSPTGFAGTRAAIMAVGADDALGTIERLELKHGLPHLTLGGEWFRNSPLLRRPYLFTDLTEHNVDRVIEFAKRGGFAYVLTFRGSWSTGNGHYEINTKEYPHGLAGMKAVADKLHAAGLKYGIHLLSACISRNDPYVRPVPDPRLAVACTFTLTNDIDEKSTKIPVDASPAGMTKVDSYATRGCDLWIDDEIVSYGDYTDAEPFTFTRCMRGRYGTRRAAHKAGAKVRYLHRLYNFYVPDPNTDLLPEIADRIATIVNECGVDMIYFDGGEAMNIVGRPWHDAHWIHREVAERLDREVLITGSGGGAGFGWHVKMRGVSNDGVNVATKRYLDEHKVPQRIAIYHRNLTAAEMGWLNLRAYDRSYPATQPDEWEYFCSKALAYDSPVSLHMHTQFFDNNGRAGECLDIIRRYEEAKATGGFSPAVLEKLGELGAEFRLIGDAETGWSFVRTQYGPTHRVESDEPESCTWELVNPFDAQPLSLRLRARSAPEPYGHESNVELFNPEDAPELHADGTRGATCTAEWATDVTHDVKAALKLTGRTNSAVRGSRAWVRHEFARRPDLTDHQSLGLWVHGDGSGAVLDVQLVEPSLIRARDHTVKLDFDGWRHFRLVDADFDAAYDYELFRHKGNLTGFTYGSVRELRLQLVGMPRNKPVTVHVGRIEALAEVARPLVNPVIEVNEKLLRIPVTLEPDQTLELGPDGTVHVYDRDNHLTKTVKRAEVPKLEAGRNRLRLRADGDMAFAYVTPILTGPKLSD